MMTVDHYENFPVASILLPKPLRAPIAAIYHFARSADDFADEGDLPPTQRILLLRGYTDELNRIKSGQTSDHPIFTALRPIIEKYELPLSLFHDLLDAFAQDVSKDRYADFSELMNYCRRSADPVGRLLLHLFGHASEQNLKDSDAICSALQLINHWQDVGIDARKGANGRIYLPQDDMQHFGVTEDMIIPPADESEAAPELRALLAFQVVRAKELMISGAPLGWRLPGRIGLEIRAIVAGGLRILDKIEAVNFDVFTRRPSLRTFDWPLLMWNSLVRPL